MHYVREPNKACFVIKQAWSIVDFPVIPAMGRSLSLVETDTIPEGGSRVSNAKEL